MITEKDARTIAALLGRAEALVAEYAVEQSWRADAMKAIREKLLAEYHNRQVENAHETTKNLKTWQDDLIGRVEAARYARGRSRVTRAS